MKKEIIITNGAPAPIGPYSQAVIVGDIIYCSGQIPVDPKTNALVEANIETQTKQVFENIRNILTAAGSDFEKVIKTNVFLKDINDFATMNQIYATYFTEGNYPARSAMEVANLPKGALLEIEVIAHK